jgi:hypothetical protein
MAVRLEARRLLQEDEQSQFTTGIAFKGKIIILKKK